MSLCCVITDIISASGNLHKEPLALHRLHLTSSRLLSPMRPSAAAHTLLPLSCFLFFVAPLIAHASPAIHIRDDAHMHMHSGQPMSEINETEILQWHLPTPPSYWSIDIEDRDPNVPRYPTLIALHALFMSLAFFVALPAGMLLPFLPPLIHPSPHTPAMPRNLSPLH